MSMDPNDVDLRQFVARERIRDQLALYCELIDAYDLDGLDRIFLDDCVCDYGPGKGGRMRGARDQIDRMRTSLARYVRTNHQLGQIRIELNGDWARSTAYATADHENPDGSIATIRVRYLDVWHEVAGSWRIAERTMLATVISGDSSGEFARAPRNRVEAPDA